MTDDQREKGSIGWIGLGRLGEPVAENFLEKKQVLHLYNRTRSKAVALQDKGAVVMNTVAELAGRCSVIFSLVSNDEALRSITTGEDGILAHMRPGGVHVSMSTISPALADELTALHKQHGSYYLAAPIMGRPESARSRQLHICLAGNAEAKQQVAGYWKDLGAAQLHDFGEKPAAANVAKLCVNFMIGANVEVLSEAFALAEKNGVSSSTLFELISGGLFNSPVVKNYGKLILQRQFEPAAFSLELGLKDLNLVLDAAGNRGVRMPVANLVKERMQQSKAKGREQLDWSAFSLIAQEEAGLS
ncbi:NAD(P)-dependent oxidoreductase [Compostibacter hankyongensis]|uniref:NAD(P)-dependent oxidoreductase n=1 Tax=Compostibacter hankyongensis TaxID=1007089 RepID=A0ABP8G9R1_9BACT